MLHGRNGEFKHTPHLFFSRLAACRDEDHLFQLLPLRLMKLVIGHRVVSTHEPVDMFGLGKRCPGRTGNPQPLARIAFLGLVLIAADPVYPQTVPFLKANDLTVAFGQSQRESETGMYRSAFIVLRCQTEMAVESLLRGKVDTPVLEIGIELLLRLPVLEVELVQVVFRDVERPDVLAGLHTFPDGHVQQAVAHEVHQPVRVYSLAVFRE